MKDLFNNLQRKRVIDPVSVSDNTAQVGQIIDRKGYNSLIFLILIGAVADADATFTVLVEHGDASNLSDAAAVPDSQLNGLEVDASFQFDSDNQVRDIGYRGGKRYVRLTITPAANTGAAVFGVGAYLGNPITAAVVKGNT